MKLLRMLATIIVVATLAAFGAAVVPNLIASAQATTLVVEGATPSTPNYQQIVNESQEPTPNLTVIVHVGACPGLEEYSCTMFPGTTGIGAVPQVWIDPQQSAITILHELGHVSEWILDHSITANDPIREEFQRIVGKPGWRWFGAVPDPYVKEAPDEEWADATLSCSWIGRVATGPTVVTPNYEFVLSASQYNQACALFARVLVGPLFTQPTAASLSRIPYNYTGSAFCGARPVQLPFCGRTPQSQGFAPERRRIHYHPPTPSLGATQAAPDQPATEATKIIMSNPREQEEFQAIVDSSQEPTPKLTIVVHARDCPESSVGYLSCVVYPDRKNSWTTPQVWISPLAPKPYILGELGYISWWELDPSTMKKTPTGEVFERLIGLPDSDWRPSGREDSLEPSASRMWAYDMLACSWLGRQIHGGQTLTTPGEEFGFSSAREYNVTCDFFLKTLVGPQFNPPTAPALPVIPRNYAHSLLCGARPELVKYCGKPSKEGKRSKKQHKR